MLHVLGGIPYLGRLVHGGAYFRNFTVTSEAHLPNGQGSGKSSSN